MVEEVAHNTPQRTKLGALLLKRSAITQQQLDRALEKQKNETDYIGEILIRLGYLEEKDIVAALIVQCHLPYIAIQNYSVDQNVLKSISSETARKFHVFPLDQMGGILSVVMADPLSDTIKEKLAQESCCSITPFIATKTEITEAINKWYK